MLGQGCSQVLAAAGAPRCRIGGGALMVAAAWMDTRLAYGKIAYGKDEGVTKYYGANRVAA